MIPFTLQVVFALILDAFFGAFAHWPRPVRWVMVLAGRFEGLTRSRLSARLAGFVSWGGVFVVTLCALGVLLWSASKIHPLLSELLSILIIASGLSVRRLWGHSRAVYLALQEGELLVAREQLGWLVGRDTDGLDETEITRACVESVAESTLDGMAAPLFYAILLGPMGIVGYKAINVMGSMFGHESEGFGWVSARANDVANSLPARLTGPLIVVASAFVGLSADTSWSIYRRDRKQHPSPNTGHMEAAFAGALEVQLGGRSDYKDLPRERPTIGDPIQPLKAQHIPQANQLMLITLLVSALVWLSLRTGFEQVPGPLLWERLLGWFH